MPITSLNPHQPSDIVGVWPAAGSAAIAAAVSRAQGSAAEWDATPSSTRAHALEAAAAALEQRSGEVGRLTVREVGKPVAEARAEVARGVAILRYHAQTALLADGEILPSSDPAALLMVRRSPLGVVALITPWNFPVAIPLWKAAPSLVSGNPTILKPAEAGTAVALLLSEIISPLLPSGVFQVVPGDAGTGRLLIRHPEVAAVSFTGSRTVGREVVTRSAARGARVQAEMGGQNPSVVLADADLDRAASTVAQAAMGYAGQKCTATSRVIVERAVYRRFRDRLVAAIEALQVVDPANEHTLVGPVIDEQARARALEAVSRSGGRLLTGGSRLDHPGFYLSPTLVELDQPTGPLAEEEVFAPVAALLPAESAEAAVTTANAVRYGLAAALFTSDLERALRLSARLEAGMVRVNAPTTGVDYHAPFGGIKESSYGPREQGRVAREFYTQTRTILIAP